jgi:hypothetical protein
MPDRQPSSTTNLDRYGDAALAAFAARLDALTPEQRRRLEELEGR